MKDLTHKMAQFFSGEDFAEHGDDARLELTPAELRQISNLMTENARLKAELAFIEKETTLYMLRKKEFWEEYCPKFKNQQEKHRVFHTVTAVEKFFSVIGNDDAIDDISILKELVRKIEVMGGTR